MGIPSAGDVDSKPTDIRAKHPFSASNKKERIKRFKSMSSIQRQELILKKMKERGIEVGSGIPNKKYDSKEVYELIHIANYFPELREKK